MLIIPAIDLRRGKCVRLLRGEPDKETVYFDDPVAVARHWEQLGAAFLHVVDLDGAFEGRPAQMELVKRIAQSVAVPVEIGGGIRDWDTVNAYLQTGLNRVILGTKALQSVEWLAELCRAYPGRIVAGVDATGGMVAVKGWLEVSEITTLELAAKLRGIGLRAAIFTDISRDGTLEGPNLEATREFAEHIEAPVIASGGIGNLDHVRALARLPIEGMIIGRALYSNAVSLPEAILAA